MLTTTQVVKGFVMPDFKKVLDFITAEWAVISSAPILWIAQSFLTALVLWLMQKWAFGTVITHKDAKIANLEERLKMRDDQLANKVNSTPPEEAQKLIAALQSQLEGLAPRRLSESQKEKISSLAVSRGGDNYTMTIVHDMSASDGAPFARDFNLAFGKLQGWTMNQGASMGTAQAAPCGLALGVGDPKHLSKPERIVYELLQSAGVKFEMIVQKFPNADVSLVITPKFE